MAAGLDGLKLPLNFADERKFTGILQLRGDLLDRLIDNVKSTHCIKEASGHGCSVYGS